MADPLQAPFPWYGGKSRIASLVWERFGDTPNYCEPFFGSGAVLLGRPHGPGLETINDAYAFLANFFRALRLAPDEVAYWCAMPVNEADLHAVHSWLVGQREAFTARLMGDPGYYDAQVAGRWCWGLCCWIGSGWCNGQGPWVVRDGRLMQQADTEQGINRKRPHLGTAGKGVNRKRPHLSTAGQGVNRQRPHLGTAGQGVKRGTQQDALLPWFHALAARLARVRVCCGDWSRILGPSPTWKQGCTSVFLDPPYSAEEVRDSNLYAVESLTVAHDVRAWCVAEGQNPLLRIALCGYGDVHDELLAHGWDKVTWQANGGYGNQSNGQGRANKVREVVYFSPHCLQRTRLTMFHER